MSTDPAAELLLSGAAVLLLTHSSRIIQRSTRGARWTSPYSPATSNTTTSIVLLWVAASLQHNAVAIQTNAVFASCLLVVVVGPVAPTTRVLRTPVTDANFPTATAGYAPTAVSLPSRYQWWARTSVSVTPTALWTSLFFDTTTRPWYNPISATEPVARVSVALLSGVATWVMLMAWHYYRYRRRKPPAQLHYSDAGSTFGTPWNVTEHTNKQSMEQHWYQWTVYETIVWMEDVVRQQQQQTNDDYEIPFDVATFLGPEQIHGYQLPQLTTRDLTVLGIPMDTALGITKAIVQLLQQHPGPNGSLFYGNQSDSTVYPTIRTTDWLAQHDAEYNCVNIRGPPVQTYPQPTSLSNFYSAAPTHYHPKDQPQQQQQQQQQQRPLTRETADLPDDAQERAQRMMRDRYGLELPAFRTATVCTDSGGDTVSPGTYRNDDSQTVPPTTGAVPPDGPVPSSSSSAPVHLTQSNSNGRAPPSPSATTLPSDFVANLPPHIADILRHKPDLVAQVLRSHRRATHRNDGAQAVVPQSSHETSLPLDSSIKETHSPGADNNDVGDVESTPLLADTPSAWGADNNQETAELLLRIALWHGGDISDAAPRRNGTRRGTDCGNPNAKFGCIPGMRPIERCGKEGSRPGTESVLPTYRLPNSNGCTFGSSNLTMGDNLLDDLLDDILIDTGAGTEHDDLLDHLLGDDKDGNAAIPTLQETLHRRSHHSSNRDNTAAHDDNDDDIDETGHDGDNISLPTETESGIVSTPDFPSEHLSASTEEEITFGPDETIVPANPTLRTEPWNAPTPPSTPWKTTDSKHRLRRRAPEDVTLAQSDAFLRRGLRSGNDTTVRAGHRARKIKIARAEQTRKVTVPLTPNFHGRSVAQPVGRNASRNQATWAQSSRVFSEGLRDGKDNVPTAAKDHDPNHNRLTVPVGPKFHGTPHEIHKPPKFHEDLSMAESVASFGRGLRRSTKNVGTSPPKARHRGVTVPVEPKFHSTTHYTRNRPKSAEEQEAELMEYYKANPIKANPLPNYLAASGGNARPHHRSKQVDAASYVQKDELDALECRKQFKARPMPHFSEETLLSKTHERRPLTQTEPFRFRVARLDSPTRKTNAAPTSPESSVDDNVAVAFKARPVPKSTYVSPPRKTKTPRPSVANLTPQVLTHPRSYDPARDASRHMQADNRVRQQAQAKQSRQRDQHWQDMQHAMQSLNMGKSTPTIKPFQLESVTRHEAYQAGLAIKRAQEERELYERAQFKARPVGFTKQA